jgi:hypothetical protein
MTESSRLRTLVLGCFHPRENGADMGFHPSILRLPNQLLRPISGNLRRLISHRIHPWLAIKDAMPIIGLSAALSAQYSYTLRSQKRQYT